MDITFISKSTDGVIEFTSELEIKDGVLVFEDKSIENTIVVVEVINDKMILLERFGDTNMSFNMILDKKVPAKYNNKMGLVLDISIFTKEINIKKEQIYMKYDYFIEEEYQNTYEIYLLIK